MKRRICLYGLIFFFMVLNSCLIERDNRMLNLQLVRNAKTALVINTDWIDDDEPWRNNQFYMQFRSAEFKKKIAQYVKSMQDKHGDSFSRYLSRMIVQVFTSRGVPRFGLDRKNVYNSRDFPIQYKEEIYRCGLVARDYSSLTKNGYTHVLEITFLNTLDYTDEKNKIPMVFFGFAGLLYDIRGSEVTEPPEKRNTRVVWRYSIVQAPRYRSSTTEIPWHDGSKMVITTTWTIRECLNILCIHRDKSPYTLEELLQGRQPFYLEIYKSAALVNLGFALKYLKAGSISQVQQTIVADDLVSRVKVP